MQHEKPDFTGPAERVPVIGAIGLDLSLVATGFCSIVGDEIKVETIKTTPKTADNDLARLAYIRDKILARVHSNVAMVCIEDFFTPRDPMRIRAAIGLAMLGAVVRLALLEHGIPFYVIIDSQLKKYATGKGLCQKSIVVREVYRRWGVETSDDNQADACVLAHMARDLVQPSPDMTAFQSEIIGKVKAERPSYNV